MCSSPRSSGSPASSPPAREPIEGKGRARHGRRARNRSGDLGAARQRGRIGRRPRAPPPVRRSGRDGHRASRWQGPCNRGERLRRRRHDACRRRHGGGVRPARHHGEQRWHDRDRSRRRNERRDVGPGDRRELAWCLPRLPSSSTPADRSGRGRADYQWLLGRRPSRRTAHRCVHCEQVRRHRTHSSLSGRTRSAWNHGECLLPGSHHLDAHVGSDRRCADQAQRRAARLGTARSGIRAPTRTGGSTGGGRRSGRLPCIGRGWLRHRRVAADRRRPGQVLKTRSAFAPSSKTRSASANDAHSTRLISSRGSSSG